jgi:hypothetical protein
MEIRISVLSSGEILLDGKATQLSVIEEALERADRKEDSVLYYRETAQAEPPSQAADVMSLIISRKLPVSFSTKPDFSDYVDRFGRSHLRPIEVERLSRDPFEPQMPDVDLRPKVDDVFVEARRAASRENGAGGLVIVKPDRGLIVLPPMPPSPAIAKLAGQLPNMIPADRRYSIAAITNTSFTMLQAGAAISLEDANRAIPFVGFLRGWSQIGHQVWVFEGHPSALAEGLTDSDFLLLDSGMLPFLQSDWMAVARRAMKPGGKVFLHQRENYRLFPLAVSSMPPGWRISESDGEASYANCLLTTLAKGTAESTEIVSGNPVPDLAGLTTDPQELDWVAGLPFRYDLLDAGKVIAVLLGAAGRSKVNPFRNEWVLKTRLESQKDGPRNQTFVFRRQRKGLKTILHIGKR